MNKSDNPWLDGVVQKLSSDGFEISRNVANKSNTFKVIAHGMRLDPVVRYGNSSAFFIFKEFDISDIETLRKFSNSAFLATKAIRLTLTKSDGKLKTRSLVSFPVAIVQSVEESVVDSIRHKSPPIHWAAFEVPIIFDQSRRQLYYFEKTPLWGCAYYSDFRAQIKRYLLC